MGAIPTAVVHPGALLGLLDEGDAGVYPSRRLAAGGLEGSTSRYLPNLGG